jgi:hypothetical protein
MFSQSLQSCNVNIREHTVLLQRRCNLLQFLSRCQCDVTCDKIQRLHTSRTAESSSTLDCRPSKIVGSIIPDGAAMVRVAIGVWPAVYELLSVVGMFVVGFSECLSVGAAVATGFWMAATSRLASAWKTKMFSATATVISFHDE